MSDTTGVNKIGGLNKVLPMFDGRHEGFALWWERFSNYAYAHKFQKALQKGGEADLPMDSEVECDTSTDKGKKQEAARDRNNMAVAQLSACFTSDSLLRLSYKAKSTEWPMGLAHKLVELLFERYELDDDLTAAVQIKTMLNNVTSMNDMDDPAVLFEKIAAIEMWSNCGLATGTESNHISDADLIATVLSKAPMKYQYKLSSERRRLGKQLTVDALENTMRELWRQFTSIDAPGWTKTASSKTQGNEMTLGVFAEKRKCYHCGEVGHIKPNCPKRNTSKGGEKDSGNGSHAQKK